MSSIIYATSGRKTFFFSVFGSTTVLPSPVGHAVDGNRRSCFAEIGKHRVTGRQPADGVASAVPSAIEGYAFSTFGKSGFVREIHHFADVQLHSQINRNRILAFHERSRKVNSLLLKRIAVIVWRVGIVAESENFFLVFEKSSGGSSPANFRHTRN